MAFEFEKLEIDEVILIKPLVLEDERGFFMESYKKSEFEKNGIVLEFRQDNHSKSKRGILRGLHYQKHPLPQAKLVRCLRGEIFDVAVDIRKNSPTFKKWCGAVLGAENKSMLYIPEGFAHGFVVLSDEAEVLYKVSNEYSPKDECGILWNDPEIRIDWGIDFEPVLSEKDLKQPKLSEIPKEDLP